jgi:hypothetical protein
VPLIHRLPFREYRRVSKRQRLRSVNAIQEAIGAASGRKEDAYWAWIEAKGDVAIAAAEAEHIALEQSRKANIPSIGSPCGILRWRCLRRPRPPTMPN